MQNKILVTFVLLLAIHSTAVKGDEISELKELILEQSKIIQQLHERVEQLEARQKLKEQSLTQKIEELAEMQKETPALPDALKWAEKVKISGDLRFRHEHIDSETSGSVRWKKGRDRQRIRARLMLEAIINDEWDVAFRLASGERSILADEDDMFADPVSSNQTLKQNFSSKDIWLDLAYFNWHPAAREGLNVYGGKIKNPFYKVGKNQLVWDSDLNPEGIAATYVIPLGKKNTLHIAGGGFWVDESSSGVDTSLWGIQGYLKHTIGNPNYIIAGVSYWDYGNIQGKTDTYCSQVILLIPQGLNGQVTTTLSNSSVNMEPNFPVCRSLYLETGSRTQLPFQVKIRVGLLEQSSTKPRSRAPGSFPTITGTLKLMPF